MSQNINIQQLLGEKLSPPIQGGKYRNEKPSSSSFDTKNITSKKRDNQGDENPFKSQQEILNFDRSVTAYIDNFSSKISQMCRTISTKDVSTKMVDTGVGVETKSQGIQGSFLFDGEDAPPSLCSIALSPMIMSPSQEDFGGSARLGDTLAETNDFCGQTLGERNTGWEMLGEETEEVDSKYTQVDFYPLSMMMDE